MTTDSVVVSPVELRSHRGIAPIAALGWREARRILRSPIYLAVGAFIVLTMGLGAVVNFSLSLPSAAHVYDGVLFFTILYAGVLTYMAAHLVTSSSRRTHADRQLAASPLAGRARVGGLCSGVLFGPGGVALCLLLLLAWMGSFVTLNGVANDSVMDVFSVAELSQVFLTVVGGGLFGVLVATWLRFPGSLPIGLVVLVVGTAALFDPKHAPWFAPWISSASWTEEPWTLTGSQAWHAVYLLGLCALAVCGVMLREREGRVRWLWISALVFAATAAAGLAQL